MAADHGPRACIGAVALPLAGVLCGRVDLVVLAAPFVTVAARALMRRPTTNPAIDSALAHRWIREGEATAWTVTITPGDSIDVAAAQVTSTTAGNSPNHLASSPSTANAPPGEPGDHRDRSPILQWGRRQIGPALVAASSALGAFRFGPTARNCLSSRPCRCRPSWTALHRAQPGRSDRLAPIAARGKGARVRHDPTVHRR